HRDQNLGPQPAVKRLQLWPAGMSRNMDRTLAIGNDLDIAVGQTVLDAADGKLVAGYLTAREKHDIASLERDRMGALGNAQKRGARLALATGGDDQYFAARQLHRRIEIDRRREMLEIAARLARRDHAIERASGDAELAPGTARDLAQRLQPRDV